MDINENGNVMISSSEDVTVIQQEADFAPPPPVQPKKKPKKKTAARRSAEDRRTMGLLFAILTVGVCLLCVSVIGMVGVAGGGIQTAAPETTTVATGTQGDIVTPDATTQPGASSQVTPGADSTTAANSDNSASDASAPQTDEQWLSFFNDAVNKLKTEAPAMTKSKQTKTADIQLSNSLGNAYVSAAKDKYLSDEVVETPIAKGDKAAAQANVSPDGAAYVSKLTMADIKSISHTTDGNGNYVITIAMNDVSNPDLNSSYAKIFQFMLVDDVMNTYAPDMGATVDRSNVELKYSKCSATATITPDGKVVSYETTVNANMILRDAKVKVINTDLDATLYSITKYYNINW